MFLKEEAHTEERKKERKKEGHKRQIRFCKYHEKKLNFMQIYLHEVNILQIHNARPEFVKKISRLLTNQNPAFLYKV